MLLLLVATVMMFAFPDRETVVERFSDAACDAPVAQDIPFLSRQESGDHGAVDAKKWAKKWTESPPRISWDRRSISELETLACITEICRPPSVLRRQGSARGPPHA